MTKSRPKGMSSSHRVDVSLRHGWVPLQLRGDGRCRGHAGPGQVPGPSGTQVSFQAPQRYNNSTLSNLTGLLIVAWPTAAVNVFWGVTVVAIWNLMCFSICVLRAIYWESHGSQMVRTDNGSSCSYELFWISCHLWVKLISVKNLCESEVCHGKRK